MSSIREKLTSLPPLFPTPFALAVLHSSSNFVLSQGIKGSCTACILTINQDNGQLHAANLGDSGFMVLGRAKVSTLQLLGKGLCQGIGRCAVVSDLKD